MNAERLAAALALAAACIGAAVAQAPAAPAFERAMADYDAQRFAAAFEALSPLADAGHREAARIALLMTAHGPRLYGRRFEVDGARRARWLEAATAEPRVATLPAPQ